ncbi:CsbD family protein [Legionella anisa]|uniref:CsbD family protein n=1 Tax=Legionella anisa TaxID=28082 RepID=A0AAX0X1F6_9GAMM|nr:CsbD family protein [Legionella anisa]AWN75837.1 CsbD family protein [Legionella anisa]KTC69206.1 stress response protein [Legionella anisa]MBN5934425.1 CsbD family protein [Legionella anisa]MCW8424706.1 CsbD family protein [Legionella anisa]MCW8446175.1 CsbD family protein [Legionella anisa]
MNQNIFQGKWMEIKGQMKQFWGKLTDDDLKQIEGNQQEIFGKLRKHYGYTEEQAKKAVHDFQKKMHH